MSPVIIIAYKPGQLSNRLLQSATFIAYSERTGARVVNVSMDEYAPLFDATDADLLCRYPPTRARLPRGRRIRRALYRFAYSAARALVLLGLAGSRLRVVSVDWEDRLLLDGAFADNVRDAWIVFIQGWRIFVPPPPTELAWCGPPGGIEPQAAAIREYFRPRPSYRRRVDDLLARSRSGCDLLVGVHIRQGDFLTDKNQGRYYYATDRYVQKMRETSALYPGERVGFLVCSNEEQRPESFAGLRCTFGGEDAVVDLYALAGCDLILGPPSSFSLWASFYGGRRLCWLFDIEEKLLDQSFRPFAPVDQDEFAERFYGYTGAKRGVIRNDRARPS